MPLTPGTRLGSYDVVAALGAGGMGEVYRARDRKLGREVALKVLPAEVAGDADRLARFEREARTVAGLNHPNIVTLYSFENEEGVRFLTMELIEGESLERHLAAGGLPVAQVVELGAALADALAAAHEKGVVHRDLKPANVMLTRDGRIKMLDFGLAKLGVPDSVADSANAPTVVEELSIAGQVVGTVPYMAPEQVRGEAVDSRTDLFSLGVVLYEMATGRRPFRGATHAVVLSAILRDPPEGLSSVRADVPSALERIVGRCLEKDPGERFHTAREIAAELRRLRLVREAASVVKLPPVPSTPLLGRESALDQAAEKLRAGARVLTITGYGGTGKTRFAIELFRRLAPDYSGGAAFVSLAAITAPSDVLPAVAATLEIAEAHGRASLDTLATYFVDRPVLLLLDNLEQVLDAAPQIAELVARCPGLQVIATSRAPLKIGAETELPLPPLELPGTGAMPLDALAICPSVALFVQRAEKVRPGFALDGGNAAAVAAICRRLDGLPLALELAAARVRVLAPAALLSRLDHALDLLTSGDRDLPIRQRTLRATISWSYSLLGPGEQRLLRWLSVFHEGWTLEGIERVCYLEDERFRALDELDSLVEKGLVRVDGAGERYALLETVRAFAAEQLHAGAEVAAARAAHAAHYLTVTAEIHAGIRGTAQLATMRRARRESANFQAALHWLTAAAKSGDPEAVEKALLFCGHLNWAWHISAQHNSARRVLDELLPLAAGRPASRGRGLAWLASGMIETTTGDFERSLADWRRGHEDGLAVADGAIAAEGSMGVGYCQLSLGNLDEAATALADAIEHSVAAGDEFMRTTSMTLEGIRRFASGDAAAGRALVEQALESQRRRGDYELGGVALSALAQITFSEGDTRRALALYAEALVFEETVGDRPEVARILCEMGWTALAAGEPKTARGSFRKAAQAYEEIASARGTGGALLGLAAVDAAEGNEERAVRIAAAARAFSEREGIVVDHPMDPGAAARIEALKASVPGADLDGLVADAAAMTPAAILALVGD
jgi:non-specific serine/threonine protein kinase